MGIISDFFIADESIVPNYDGGEGIKDAEKCQLTDLTPLQTAQFLAVLIGKPYHVEMIRDFKFLTPEDADDWIISIPREMISKLAAITPGQILDVASRFSQATNAELGWSVDEFIPVVTELVNLAQRAIQTRRTIYLWNSL